MKDDWAPGDQALCRRPCGTPPVTTPGGVYTVSHVFPQTAAHWASLNLEGVRNPDDGNSRGWLAANFTKIEPLTDDERDDFLRSVRKRFLAWL